MIRPIHAMHIERVLSGAAIDYVAVCLCGWENVPVSDIHRAATTVCAVYAAELEGMTRKEQREAINEPA